MSAELALTLLASVAFIFIFAAVMEAVVSHAERRR